MRQVTPLLSAVLVLMISLPSLSENSAPEILQPTPVPKPTQMVSIESADQWPILLSESFDDNRNDWPIGHFDDRYATGAWEIAEGEYQWDVTARQDVSKRVTPNVEAVSDFFLTVEARQNWGPDNASYGVIFQDENGEDLYYFGINEMGVFSFFLLYKDQWQALIDWTSTDAIKPGTSNRITIVAVGSHFTLKINNALVGEVEDDHLDRGHVGLSVELYNQGDHAGFAFDNFELRTPFVQDQVMNPHDECSSSMDHGNYEDAVYTCQTSAMLYKDANDTWNQAEALHTTGWAHHNLGNYLSALDFYQQALPLRNEAGDTRGEGQTLHNIGLAYQHMSEYESALEYYEQALDVRQRIGDRWGQGWTQNNMGKSYEALGEYEKAQTHLGMALELGYEIEDQEMVGEAHLNLGVVAMDLEQFDQGLTHFEQAVEIWREFGDWKWWVDEIAEECWERIVHGNLQGALGSCQGLRFFCQQLGDKWWESEALNNLGIIYQRKADYLNALDYYQEAIRIAEVAEYLEGKGWPLNNIGEIYRLLGKYDEAWDYLNQAMDIWLEIRNRNGEAWTLNSMGTVHYVRSDYEGALDLFQQSLELSREIDYFENETRALNNLGAIYSSLGDFEQALDYFEEGLQVAKETGDHFREGYFLNNIGSSFHDLGEEDKVLPYLEQALTVFEDVGGQYGQAFTMVSIGEHYWRNEEYDLALANLKEALEIMRQIKNLSGEAFTLSRIGLVYFAQDNRDEALVVYQEALSIYEEIGDQAGQAETLELIGQVLEERGEQDQALDSYLKSIDLHETIRSQVQVESYQAFLAGQEIEVYQRAVRLLVEGGALEKAFNITEQNRAKGFLNSLGNKRPDLKNSSNDTLLQTERDLRNEITALENILITEQSKPVDSRSQDLIQSTETQLLDLQGRYEDLIDQMQLANPELASLVTVTATNVEETKRLLDEGTTLISYYFTEQNSLAFILGKNIFHVIELPLSPDEISVAVKGFRTLGLANLEKTYPKSLDELYMGLIAPLESYLETSSVGIIPHQELHYVPFAALYDGERFLGERFTIFYLPSATTLPYIMEKSSRERVNPLIFGDPESGNPK